MGIINPYANKPDTDGPEVRLLVCSKCKTIEVLDDYTGPPERAEDLDVVLNTTLEKHKDGVERIPHIGQIFRVRQSSWVLMLTAPAAYDAIMDNFKADALKCWEQHMRTPACSDYKSDAKQIVPDTAQDRKEAGVGKFDRHNPSSKRYLCEYCPVHSLVQQAQRDRAGLYE